MCRQGKLRYLSLLLLFLGGSGGRCYWLDLANEGRRKVEVDIGIDERHSPAGSHLKNLQGVLLVVVRQNERLAS